MTIHEEYTALIRKRYGDAKNGSYQEQGEYDFVYFGPEQYLVEASMLSYAKKRPNATLREMFDYFNGIAPEGLAPGDDGADLLEDE